MASGAQILVDLGLTSIRLMTNNPRKLVGLEAYVPSHRERFPLEARPTHAEPALLARQEGEARTYPAPFHYCQARR